MTSIAPLFAPFSLGPLHLPNRIVMAPMTRGFSPGGVPGPEVAEYYRRRAEGGVGLIVTEGTWIPHGGASNEDAAPRFHGEDALAGWKAVLDAVHGAGGRIIPQLWHVGLIRKQPSREFPEGLPPAPEQVGPSGIGGGFGHPLVAEREPMTLAEIDAVIDAFATAAESAHRLGFDGVELHGAHGYIIDQFFWHATNMRSDRFGGDLRDRARFAAEIVQEVRRRTAPDFPIVLRYSQWKSHDYDARLAESPQELAMLLEPLVEAGVDMFDCSQRRFWKPAFDGSPLNLAGWTRKLTGRPTITVGSVSLDVDFMSSMFLPGTTAGTEGLERLLDMMGEGQFDLVAVGRALLADPEWAAKIRAGSLEALTPFTASALGRLD